MPALVLGVGVGAGGLSASTGSAGATSLATVTFSIDATADNAAISPLIYGVNADATQYDSPYTGIVEGADPTVVRLGGDRWTAYDWETNASNAGADYCYESDDFLAPSSTTPGAAVQGTIDADDGAGIDTLVTVPIQGYVAADEDANPPDPSTDADTSCPQDVRNSPNYLTTRFDPEAPIDPNGPTADPTVTPGATVYQDDFAQWLKVNEPEWTPIFDLDNEPEYWSSTHPEVHPDAATYAEVVDDDVEYAKAIKQVYPNAEIAGPVMGGYYGLLTLDEPDQYQSSDYQTYGDFTDYYLKQVAAANQAAGTTLIGDFDLHWYPQDPSVPDDGTSAEDDAYREQWPRSLWDPSFVEESSSYLSSFGAIDLIPWLKGKIASDDPGMNLNFDEWDYGAGGDISGAIATADTLGIFGKYGVHLATYFPEAADESYAYAAFRMFRDYDGDGDGFGDTEVAATNSDPVNTSVYASIDAADPHHMVIVAINKNTVDETATIDIAHEPQYAGATIYTLTAAGGAQPVKSSAPLEPTSGGDTYSYDMPAQSVSVIVPALAPDNPELYADTPPAAAISGQAYSYTFGATGTPAPSFSVAGGALPPGLALAPSSGVLSGTPTTPGTYTFTVQASNGVTPAAISPSLTIDVQAPATAQFSADTPPSLTDTATPYHYTFAASGEPAPTFTVASGTLPPGLSLDPDSGALTGTATTSGLYTFVVQAANGVSPPALSPTLTIKVTPPLPGDVFAWGTTNGQSDLGTDPTASPLIPEPVAFPAAAGKIVAIAQGDAHSLAVTASGQVYAWGDDSDGELGDGNENAEPSPVLVHFPQPAPDIVAVAAGYDDSMALDSDGNVWTWGDDALGELGNGADNSYTTAPAEVDLSSVGGADDSGRITAIAAGSVDDYALTSSGNVIAWGDGTDGALGDGSTSGSEVPVPVSLGAAAGEITAITAGGTDRALALTRSGTMLAWGFNDDGELGNGSTTASDTPVTVVGPGGSGTLTGVTAIGAGDFDSYAVLGTDGAGLAWGAGANGELGNGGTTQSSVPVAIGEPTGGAPAMAPLVAATGGFYADFVLAKDGKVYGFGEDNQTGYGLVGDGQNNTTDLVPSQVSFPAGTFIAQIAGSDATTLALAGGSEPTVPPANTALPTVTGTPAVGDTLTCDPGTWSGDQPQTYAYEWLVDASPVDTFSATATYVVRSADADEDVACVVEADNDATTNQAESAAVAIASTTAPTTTTTTSPTTAAPTTNTAPTTTPPTTTTPQTTTAPPSTSTQPTTTATPGSGTSTPAKLILSPRAPVSKGGIVTLALACRGSATCRGTLTLTATETTGHRHRHKLTVRLGSVPYRLAAGGHLVLRLRLTAAGFRLLKASHDHLTASVSGVVGGGRPSIGLSLP